MTIKVLNEQQILTEVMQVLMIHLEPSKVLRFWAACSKSESDYLKLKEQLLATETVGEHPLKANRPQTLMSGAKQTKSA